MLSTPTVILSIYTPPIAAFILILVYVHDTLATVFGVPHASWASLFLSLPAAGSGWLVARTWQRHMQRTRWTQARQAGVRGLSETPDQYAR